MLENHALHVDGGIVLRQFGRIEARAWNDVGAKMAQDVVEVAVARALRDQEVELDVGRHRVAAGARIGLKGIERAAQLLQLHLAATAGSEAASLGLKADAQLENGEHVAHGDHRGRIDAEYLGRRRREHEGADAMARFHQAGGLQVRNRLAHDGPADALNAHDFRLGRQLVARFVLAVEDALGDVRDHALGQIAVLLGRRRWGGRRVHELWPG